MRLTSIDLEGTENRHLPLPRLFGEGIPPVVLHGIFDGGSG